MTDLNFGPATNRLLRLLAEYDKGDGVRFEVLPRNRWLHEPTGQRFNGRSFWPPTGNGLADEGDGYETPVKLTAVGRETAAKLAREDAA
jgi:hypothetical protein